MANLDTKLQTPKLVATTEIGKISVFPIYAILYTELIPNFDPNMKRAIQNYDWVLMNMRLVIPANPIKYDKESVNFNPSFL